MFFCGFSCIGLDFYCETHAILWKTAEKLRETAGFSLIFLKYCDIFFRIKFIKSYLRSISKKFSKRCKNCKKSWIFSRKTSKNRKKTWKSRLLCRNRKVVYRIYAIFTKKTQKNSRNCWKTPTNGTPLRRNSTKLC